MIAKTHHGLLVLIGGLTLACGGSPKQQVGTTPVGESTGARSGSVADDLDVADNDGEDSGEKGTDGQSSAGQKSGAPTVTFRLKNTHSDDLVLSLDKGWQPVISAYSGKPPNAKPILMFPTHCTGACNAGDDERCPVCKAPENVKDIKAAEKREVVAAGKTLDVPWDGKVYVYEGTKASGRSCECFKREKVPAETYTIRACGFRITKSASKSTRLQCVKAEATFPGEGEQVVEIEFGKP